MKVDLIQIWGDDLTVVNSARVSFGKTKTVLDDKDIKLIKYMAKHNHVSVFEHCGVTFRLEIPIFIARQLMRHRSHSFNEISGRYVEFEDEFFVPSKFRQQDENLKQGSKSEEDSNLDNDQILDIYNFSLEQSYNNYKKLLELGVCKEQARALLPLALMTQLYATCNLRSLVHFLMLRLDSHSQKEIRDVALEMLRLVKETDNFKYTLEAYGL